jgi:hypothetical protein
MTFMDAIRRVAAILSCQQAATRFFAALDASDHAAVAAGVAPTACDADSVRRRQGKTLRQ